MGEFLLELFSEEIPARMQARAAEDLKRLVTDGLKAARLEFAGAEAHATPRRLALCVDGLPARQPDLSEERKGPRVDAPQKAIDGFLRSAGVGLEDCEQREIKGHAFWFARIERPGAATAELLPGVVAAAVQGLPWPKSMRFADQSLRWVRPLHHVLALFDGKPLAGGIDLGGPGSAGGSAEASGETLAFTDTTRGHRFLAPDAIAVTDYVDYKAKLAAAKVMLDREDRKATIRKPAEALATAEGLALQDDPGLLDEVAGLVEWPVVLIGRIDDAFMDIPPEVLITSMRTHQKYFALRDAEGALAPRFIVVAGTETNDGGKAVVAGNERVLRARLADAKFFWDQDRKQRLEERLPALEPMVFHARLGTLRQKVDRVLALAGKVAAHVPGADAAAVERAALLCKADLVTGMVGEFPELQGVMGRYYALEQGEDAAVADAIAEHYAPLGPNDRCPTAPVSVALALADKLDTLVGFFAIGETSTGSKDPFALRRAALGVIRLIVENKLRLPLRRVFAAALELHGMAAQATEVERELMGFFADRLKVHLRQEGVRHDLIAAVFGVDGEDDLVRLLARVAALQAFLDSDDGANLLVAYRRAVNIVRIEEKRDGATYDDPPDDKLAAEPAERTLFQALDSARGRSAEALEAEDFAAAMAALAATRSPVDTFFDDVTVNCDDAALRANRLKLLSQIRSTLGEVADFAQIEG
jgi:glycyl-tRNA synthetase beta chain